MQRMQEDYDRLLRNGLREEAILSILFNNHEHSPYYWEWFVRHREEVQHLRMREYLIPVVRAIAGNNVAENDLNAAIQWTRSKQDVNRIQYKFNNKHLEEVIFTFNNREALGGKLMYLSVNKEDILGQYGNAADSELEHSITLNTDGSFTLHTESTKKGCDGIAIPTKSIDAKELTTEFFKKHWKECVKIVDTCKGDEIFAQQCAQQWAVEERRRLLSVNENVQHGQLSQIRNQNANAQRQWNQAINARGNLNVQRQNANAQRQINLPNIRNNGGTRIRERQDDAQAKHVSRVQNATNSQFAPLNQRRHDSKKIQELVNQRRG